MLLASLTSTRAAMQEALRAKLEAVNLNVQEDMNKKVESKLLEVEMQLDSAAVRGLTALAAHTSFAGSLPRASCTLIRHCALGVRLGRDKHSAVV
jgi:hypothetical protein